MYSPDAPIYLMLGVGLLSISFFLYFLPTIIAGNRKLKNFGSILVLNLFLGWTFVGWVVFLAMSVSSTAQVRSTSPKP